MSAAKSHDVLSAFWEKDPSLLKDVAQMRSLDIVHLTQRLEAAVKVMRQMTSDLDPSLEDVQTFVSDLVKCFMAVSEKTRLARGLEKLLGATGPGCVDMVRRSLGAELLHVLQQLTDSAKHLKKVSGLLEHSRLVQEGVSDLMTTLLTQLSDLFLALLTPVFPDLSREDSEKLYYTVKVCLQLLQQRPSLRQQAWESWRQLMAPSKDSEAVCGAHRQQAHPMLNIVAAVLSVLVRKKYSRDVTLLAGTAMAMIVTAAPDAKESAKAFLTAHAIITDKAPVLTLANLHLHCAAPDANTTMSPENKDQNHTAEIALLRSILQGSTQNVLCCDVTNMADSERSSLLKHATESQEHQHTQQLDQETEFSAREKSGHSTQQSQPSAHKNNYLLTHQHSKPSEKTRLSAHEQTENVEQETKCCAQDEMGLSAHEKIDPSAQGHTCPSAPQQPEPLLLHLLPLVRGLCEAGSDSQYLSFQLMALWAQSLSHLPHLSLGSSMLPGVLDLLWVNLDSPVEGVGEYVMAAFRSMLVVWSAQVEGGHSDLSCLAEELFQRALSVPWNARSRYKALGLVIPFVNPYTLLSPEAVSTMGRELVQCMGQTSLAALASDVYTAFITSVRDRYSKEEWVSKWQVTWQPALMDGLSRRDSQIRNKICAYWLPSTLKILLNTGPQIQQYLQHQIQSKGDHSQELLFCWVSVCRNIRSLSELDLTTLSPQLLTEAVHSGDEDVRSEALSLLATTQKKAEPLGSVEIELFQAALPDCLKVDSAPFRQKLVNSLRKAFLRIRDSCSTALKRKTNAQFIDPSVRFMDWLYRLAMANLAPGACFQRRRMSLDIVQTWLETVIFVETDGAKKGKAQGPTDVLMKHAWSKGLWDFFSCDNRTSLLHCVLDGADEIQDLALHILIKYFPWRMSGEANSGPSDGGGSGDGLATHLLHHGLTLCDSPRAYENHSGALLVRLVYEKFIREQGYIIQQGGDACQETAVSVTARPGAGGDSDRSQDCVSFFTDLILHRILASLKASEVDVLLASKSSPTHGMLQALCECLQTEQELSGQLDTDQWGSVLAQTVSVSTAVISLVLGILADGQRGNCPSFQQMGVALEQLATEGAAEQEVTSLLSPEFQLLLSWCWLNLKESCTCLGVVTWLGVGRKEGEALALSVEVVESIGHTFLSVLTHCRHRGAIEGCRNGFLQFCTSLMQCRDPVMAAIPANILSKVLSSLEKDEMSSSVTRRSAGLPIIVQTVAQAEKRCRSNKLLQQTVSRLYVVASRPPRKDCSQTQDQAPVHALNVLKAVFSDASLAGDLLGHLGRVTQLVICSFESSSWAVRNAATQLVSTLVTRMFGQRNKASFSCNVMTLTEWSAHFPELLAFVRGKLEATLCGPGEGSMVVQPSLFLVLTLLASLGPAPQAAQCHSLTSSLRATVLTAVSSPVYQLRELSATAVLALTPLDMTDACLRELLSRLQQTTGGRNSNDIHGTLTCLWKLLSSRRVGPSVAEDTVRLLVSEGSVLDSGQCPVVRARAVDALSSAVQHMAPSAHALRKQVVSTLVSAVFSCPTGHLQFGRALFISSAVALINIMYKTSPSSSALEDFEARCLTCDDVDMRSAVLGCLQDTSSGAARSLQAATLNVLWRQLHKETDPLCMIKISQLLVAHHLQSPSSHLDLDTDLSPRDLDKVRSRFSKLANVQAALFPLESVALSAALGRQKETDTDDRLTSSLHGWSGRLSEFSRPCHNEDFRTAAAQGLALAGQATLTFCRACDGQQAVDTVMASVVDSCMGLLEETDPKIRRVVTGFVGRLNWDNKHPKISLMNANLCSKMLVGYLCAEFGDRGSVCSLLVSKLYTPGQLTAALHKLAQARTHYLFEPEENTFFSERIQQQQELFKALLKLDSKVDAACSLADLVHELRAAIPALSSSCTRESPVYNVCGEGRVLSSLTGLLMVVRLMTGPGCVASQRSLHNDQHIASMADQVTSLTTTLMQIPNIHPALKTLLKFL